jgi:hypothetical protein
MPSRYQIRFPDVFLRILQVATAKASVAEISGIESLPLFDDKPAKPMASEAAAPAK